MRVEGVWSKCRYSKESCMHLLQWICPKCRQRGSEPPKFLQVTLMDDLFACSFQRNTIHLVSTDFKRFQVTFSLHQNQYWEIDFSGSDFEWRTENHFKVHLIHICKFLAATRYEYAALGMIIGLPVWFSSQKHLDARKAWSYRLLGSLISNLKSKSSQLHRAIDLLFGCVLKRTR